MVLFWLAVVLLLPAAAPAASVVDPILRFRRLHTAHFVIYFHQGERALAARLARIAEHTWSDLRDRLGWAPPPQTHVVLADQTDTANGWATPLPYNTVMITAAWPSGAEFIGLTDDWLRVVFAHEFTHIVHLSQSRGWARGVRNVFGRVPLAFPNLSLPGWQIEGLATYFETAVTGGGRRLAGDFRAVERESARRGATPLDRVNGGLVAWPGGASVYAYGLGFHEYLADRFGADQLVTLARGSAGRIPFTGSRAFPPTFGESLGRLWKDYQTAVGASVAPGAPAADAMATRLTFEAYDVAGGRYLPPACRGCPVEIAYSVRNPHEFPALKIVGASGGTARTLTTRYLGGAIGVGQTRLVFDQQQLHRNVSLLSDLYAVDRRDGRITPLSSGERLQDPDVSSDGRRLAATRQARGARDLVVSTLADDGTVGPWTTLLSAPDTQFATPRWSPDGRWIAVERHRIGEGAAVVLVDVESGAVHVAATGATRAVTPAWRPDSRAIVVAADEVNRPFNLFEVAIDAAGSPRARRRLTNASGGARNPDVSADGRQLLYVGYTADGFDLFSMPYPDAASAAVPPPAPPAEQPSLTARGNRATAAGTCDDAGADGADEPYTPWPTLTPRAWTPIVASDSDQVRIGLTTGGVDVLGYHGWAAALQWRTLTPAGATVPDRGRPDWSATYVYDRWVPRPFAQISQATSFLSGASAQAGEVATWREQKLELGVQLPFRRVLRSHRLLVTVLRSANTVLDTSASRDFARLAFRAGWSYRSSRVYGYSISPEDGLAVGVTSEFSGDRLVGIGDAVTLTGDLRAYRRGLRRHHVVAVRAAGGVSSGPGDLGRVFRLGGAAANPDPLDFGRGAISLLRGLPADGGAGRRIAVVNGDYRWPLLRIERGAGTFPMFIRQLHASAFVDAGHAWTARFRVGDVKWTLGAELSADLIAGYSLPLTLTAGVARGGDGASRRPDTTTAYVRVGRAF